MANSLVYSVERTAEILDVGKGAVYQACRTGEIPAIRIGKLVRIPKEQLHAMIEDAGRDKSMGERKD